MSNFSVLRASGVMLASVAVAAMAAGCSPAASNSAAASAQRAAGGALQPASVAGTGMTTFTDPTEHAFTVSAPQGWTVKGGVQRSSPVAAKTWVSVTSPDGATTILLGDPSIPMFQLAQAPYETSLQFAADYAQRAFGSACSPMTPAGSQAEPALAQAASAQTAQAAAAVGTVNPPGTQYDGGSATFACQAAGVADAVGVIDVTDVNQAGGYWGVPVLLAYRTPATSQAQTDQLARALRQSYAPNAQWQAQMVSAERQQLATIQQQGQQQLAYGQQVSAAQSQMLSSAAAASNARLNASQAAFMQQQAAQAAARNAAFGQQMYNKQTGQDAEIRYINNQTCIRWYDAAHTRCAATAAN